MKWTKQRVNNVFFVLGVVMVVVMMFTFDVSFVELWDHLCHAGYWLSSHHHWLCIELCHTGGRTGW